MTKLVVRIERDVASAGLIRKNGCRQDPRARIRMLNSLRGREFLSLNLVWIILIEEMSGLDKTLIHAVQVQQFLLPAGLNIKPNDGLYIYIYITTESTNGFLII